MRLFRLAAFCIGAGGRRERRCQPPASGGRERKNQGEQRGLGKEQLAIRRAERPAEILGADDHLAIDEAGGGDDEDADRADARKLIEAPRRNLESARPFAETLWRDQDQERADRADRYSTRLNSSHSCAPRLPSSA